MLTKGILDNLKAMLEKCSPRNPTITILHMLDLLELSRALRKHGIKMRRIRRGLWVIGVDELHVSRFVNKDQMFRFDKPSSVLSSKPKIEIQPWEEDNIILRPWTFWELK